MIDQLVNQADAEVANAAPDATAKGATDKAVPGSSTKATGDVASPKVNGSGATSTSAPLKSALSGEQSGLPAEGLLDITQPANAQAETKTASTDTAAKIGPEQNNEGSVAPTAGPSDAQVSPDSQTALVTATTAAAVAVTSAPVTAEKTSDTGSHKSEPGKQKTDSNSAAVDQSGAGTQAAASPLVAVIDAVPTAIVTGQDSSASAETSASPAAASEITQPKTNTASLDQAAVESGLVGESASSTADASEPALPGLEAEVELTPPTTGFEHVAKAQWKTVQGPETAKTSAASQSPAAQSDTAAAAPQDGLGAQSNPAGQAQPAADAATPRGPRAADTDAQKLVAAQEHVPSREAAASKGSSAAAQPANFTLDGINIAAAAGAPQAGTPTAAVSGSQSAPAALVPVSGIAVEIATKLRDDKNHFEIRLDPPELGRIHVHLDVDGSGAVSSRVVVDRSDTLDLLRRDAPSLERALQDAGLKTSNNGLQFSLRDQGFTRQDQQPQSPANARLIVNDQAMPAETMPIAYRSLSGLRSGLDIRV